MPMSMRIQFPLQFNAFNVRLVVAGSCVTLFKGQIPYGELIISFEIENSLRGAKNLFREIENSLRLSLLKSGPITMLVDKSSKVVTQFLKYCIS